MKCDDYVVAWSTIWHVSSYPSNIRTYLHTFGASTRVIMLDATKWPGSNNKLPDSQGVQSSFHSGLLTLNDPHDNE